MNPVTHFEIPTDNKERSQKFYREAFDWSFNDMPELDYSMAMCSPVDDKHMPTKPGEINGGVYVRNENIPAKSPVLVLATDDIEASAAKVTECGGEVLMGPQKVGDFGIYVQFKDPDGNILGLWQHLGN